jgi:hypothetical protein
MNEQTPKLAGDPTHSLTVLGHLINQGLVLKFSVNWIRGHCSKAYLFAHTTTPRERERERADEIQRDLLRSAVYEAYEREESLDYSMSQLSPAILGKRARRTRG